MNAVSKRKKPQSVEYHGKHKRLRIAIYDDGVARLCYKPLLWRSINGASNSNAWRYVGDFSPEQARHIAMLFKGPVDWHSDHRGMRAP